MARAPQFQPYQSAASLSSEPAFLTTQILDYEHRSKRFGRHILQGRTPGPGSVDLTSNDYLALSDDPRIIRAHSEYLAARGRGAMRSDVFRHGSGILRRFEENMAQWTGMADAVLTQSGWKANVGLIQALGGPDVTVYLDMQAHMSLWEGARSGGSRVRPFKHNDPGSLEKMLKRHGPGIVGVDSLYSTEGSLCPLADISELAGRFGALLVVDESHSIGIFGPAGAGLVAELGLTEQVSFITASLSKAFAGRGGIILGSSRHLEYFRYTSLPAIFSSALRASEAAAFAATLDVIRHTDGKRSALENKADYLRTKLLDLGFNLAHSESHIMALQPGDEELTLEVREALEERDVFGSIFCWPATGRGRALIRFSLHSDLPLHDLDRVVDACEDLRREFRLSRWRGHRIRSRSAA